MATPFQEPPAEADFGPIPATKENVESLWALTHSHPRLQKAGYVLWQLGQSDLDKKKRCERCTKVIRKGRERQKSRAESVKVAPGVAQQIAADAYPRPGRGPRQASVPAHTRFMSTQAGPGVADMAVMMRDMKLETPDGKNPSPPMDCRYHPGRIQSRLWTCCGRSMAGAPCAAEQSHTTRVYRRDELERNWAYFPTPPASPTSSSQDHVAAVALDCEMGTAASGESELIRVSAVDLFTRRVLVDSLVWPDVRMAHYNTRFSGVSRPAMDAARRAGRALAGRAAAREALWRFVGPNTVVVGHSANSDLTALRWIHPLVVDTLLLEMRIQERPQSKNEECEQEEEGEEQQQQQQQAVVVKEDKAKYPGLSLKALAKERLKREIQIKGQGHDSLEDTLATRDLCLWHMVNKPEPPIISF